MITTIIIIFVFTIFSLLLQKIKRENFKHNKNMCKWCINPLLTRDMCPKKNKIHNDFFDLLDKLDIPWQLQYGSLLGAVRNHGPIKHDTDVDIVLLSDKNDTRFFNKRSLENNIKNRIILVKLFDDVIKKDKKFNKFFITLNAYQKNKKIYNSSKKYLIQDFVVKDYYLTLSIYPKDNKYNSEIKLNYPFVFDVSFKYGSGRDDYINKFGNMCKCKWHNRLVNCPKGALKHLYGWYGNDFMKSIKNSGDSKNRIYGNKNTLQEEINMKYALNSKYTNYYDKKYGIKGYTI